MVEGRALVDVEGSEGAEERSTTTSNSSSNSREQSLRYQGICRRGLAVCWLRLPVRGGGELGKCVT